jgi:hypothetical protein
MPTTYAITTYTIDELSDAAQTRAISRLRLKALDQLTLIAKSRCKDVFGDAGLAALTEGFVLTIEADAERNARPFVRGRVTLPKLLRHDALRAAIERHAPITALLVRDHRSERGFPFWEYSAYDSTLRLTTSFKDGDSKDSFPDLCRHALPRFGGAFSWSSPRRGWNDAPQYPLGRRLYERYGQEIKALHQHVTPLLRALLKPVMQRALQAAREPFLSESLRERLRDGGVIYLANGDSAPAGIANNPIITAEATPCPART